MPTAGLGSESLFQARLRLVGRQWHANDAGGRHKDFILGTAQMIARQRQYQLHRFLAARAGKGIGIASIHHKAAGLSALQRFAAPFDFRRGAFALGQNAGDRRSRCQFDEGQIAAIPFLVAGPGDPAGDARNVRQCGGLRWGQGRKFVRHLTCLYPMF